jgi:hypothetical protein
MILRTGRTRTLTLRGAITSSVEWHIDWQNGGLAISWSYPVIYVQAPWGAWARLAGSVDSSQERAILTLQAGLGSAGNAQTITTPSGQDEVIPINDPILFTVPVEECVEITREIWDDLTNRPIPVSECADQTLLTRDKFVGHPLYKLRLFERMVVGGQMTTSVTANGTTVTYSSKVTTANEVDYSVNVTQDLTTSNRTASTSITWTIEGGGSTVPAYLPNYSYSDSYCTVSASTGGTSVNLLATTQVHLHAQVGYYRSYSVTGALKAYDIAYPGSVAILIDEDNQHLGKRSLISDGWTNSGTQYSHATIYGNRDNAVQLPAVSVEDTRCTLFAALSEGPVDGDAYTLSALGEDLDDIYVRFRCWPTFSALRASNYLLSFDNCESLTPGGNLAGQWYGLGGSVLSIENGQIKIDTAASGTQGLRRTFTNRWANLSQGIMELEMTGPPGQGITVTLYSPTGATKTWAHDWKGRPIDLSLGYPIIDLCNPDSATAAVDTWDTRWPLPTVDSDYSGVTSCNQLEITGLQNSQTYHLINLEVTWASKTSVSCMASRANWVVEQSAQISEGVTSETYIVRGILGMSDGRQSFEDGHARLIAVTSSAGTDYEMYEVPISTLLSTTGNAQLEPWPPYPGWTMTGSIVSDPPDGTGLLSDWLNTNRYLGWLRGGGWAYIPGTGWVAGTDIPAGAPSQTADLYAQVCVDRIDWYPGCGDAFSFSSTNTGAYGDTIYLSAAAILRGGGHGIVYGGDPRVPVNAQTVTNTDTVANDSAGTGTTNSIGWWESGTPFGRGERSIKTAAGSQFAYATWHNRKRQRVVLSVATPAVYRCVEYDHPRNWLHASDAKKVKSVHAWDFAALMRSTDYPYTWTRLRANPHNGSLLMLGITPASAPPYTYHVCYGKDGGLTTQELFSMTANSALIEHDLARGLWVLLYESGGAIQRRTCSDASDMSSWAAPTALSISGTLLDCAYDRRYARMALVTTSGSVTKVLSSSDSGETWTERLV